LTALIGASKTPGIQDVVVSDTGVLFEHVGGWADIRRQVPLGAETTMMMAYSMSKTITAVVALQLVEAATRNWKIAVASANDNRSYHSWVNRAVIRERSGGLERKRELPAWCKCS
jgi:Beta-lactamase